MPTPHNFLSLRSGLVGLLVLAVLPFLGLLLFAHPAIDDYDNAATVEKLGRWGAQWYWYTHWSGRFVAIGVSTLLNPLSHASAQGDVPAALWQLRAVLLLLAGALIAAVHQFFRALLLVVSAPTISSSAPETRTWALTLSVLTLAFNALPEPFTFLYWYSGAVNYILPLVLTLSFCATAMHALRLSPGAPGRRGWAWAASASLVGAIGGGEIAMLTCLVVLGAVGVWVFSTNNPKAAGGRQLWAIWAVMGLATTAVLVGAPGNWQRLGLADPDPGPWYHRWVLLLPRALLGAARVVARPPVLGAALVLVGGLLLTRASVHSSRPSQRQLVLILCAYGLVNTLGMAFLKAAFMRDMWIEAPPARVANVLVVQFLISTVALALWARPWLPFPFLAWAQLNRFRLALSVATALLLLIGQARRAWQELLFTAPAYQQQMQARYAKLGLARRRGESTVALAPLRLPTAMGLLATLPSARQRADVNTELHEDYLQKNNQFLAHHYGLMRVYLSAPPEPMRP